MRYKLVSCFTFGSTCIICMFAQNYGKSEQSFVLSSVSVMVNDM